MSQTLHILPELTDPEKQKVQNALDFWASKSHHQITFHTQDILKILSPHQDKDDSMVLVQDWRTIEDEFVVLTSEEMEQLDEEEKGGIHIGDCIFLCEDVPEEFRELVVFNLAVHKRIREDSGFVDFFESMGVSLAESKHWTANIVDIMGAEYLESFQPGFLERYLTWRKGIERTGFFENDFISEYLKGKMRQQSYRRSIPPCKRHPRKKWSYEMAGLLSSMVSCEMMESNMRALGVSRVDVLFQKLVEDPAFDPETMLRVIDYIQTSKVFVEEKDKKKFFIDFSHDSHLARQAFLLSLKSTGSDYAVILHEVCMDYYELVHRAGITLEALKDSIIYNWGAHLKQRINETPQEVSSILMKIVQNAQQIQRANVAENSVTIMAHSEQGMNTDQIQDQIGKVMKEIQSAEALLQSHQGLVQEMRDLSEGEQKIRMTSSFIDNRKQEITDHLNRLQQYLQQLQQAQKVLKGVVDFSEKSRNLIRESVLFSSQIEEPRKIGKGVL